MFCQRWPNTSGWQRSSKMRACLSRISTNSSLAPENEWLEMSSFWPCLFSEAMFVSGSVLNSD